MTKFACLILCATAVHAEYLYATFHDPGSSGVYFAISEDGYRWSMLNQGKPWLPPSDAGELMRDPFITRGPDGEFHMVWTWEWRVQSIGYAHSKDLVHWSEQKEIPLMANVPGTNNTWAPEIYWDAGKKQWLIIWSSVVEGKHQGNRIYSSMTADFEHFTTPAIFFDPGYEVIDATILETGSKYHLVFKDERKEPLKKFIQIATSASLEGPWSEISEPFTEPWTEGPSAIKIGGEYLVYYDHYRDPKRMEAVRSKDLKHWAPADVTFPEGSKHGSFLKITKEEAERLKSGPK
jgi:sucrose-6-phosphate hydrolase SacC (GH32 family)